MKVTYPDFLLYELLEWSLFAEPECLLTFPRLEAFRRRIESLPPVRTYIDSNVHQMATDREQSSFWNKAG
ncbi:unnamed protein product [Notodromas monacha]|uniref:GST C-terminal domain-containing protein n=1 Tax=Notodromas monacha TaxID=399045 RepID=A0A7R9GL41_9CRUS|nr:unnamed protein product [Notodromas monacha]CAG0925302.1 unnamed protein product [Notodromas monacha]